MEDEALFLFDFIEFSINAFSIIMQKDVWNWNMHRVYQKPVQVLPHLEA